MTPEIWDHGKRIFCEALELPEEDRLLLVERECREDSELREHVLRMLAAAGDNTSPLDVGAAERLVGDPQLTEPLLAGDIVGRYRVLRRLGQGGTSLVYLAEHVGLQSPRRFAIKVIALAFLAGQELRFEREAEILASFQHPNIARILDKGVTESGWPYLVLDYIDGEPIHQYCIDKKLAPPEIVRLILDCCRAVKYIHDNQIAHCDLKPSNILVDASGSPRILDFGIARLIDPGRKTRSGQTTRGIRPLTPNYASPEQLAGHPLTTSTDIYSLGVVLYETLAHALPFDNSGYPWEEISKKIAEQDPAPPSKARRGAALTRDDAAFAKQLRGDLDSIVLKTLAHDSARRYTIDGLIADLGQYLEGGLVEARRSTSIDRARRVLRHRHRALLEVLALTVSVGLAVGTVAWYARRERRISEARHLAEMRNVVQSSIPALPRNLPGSVFARRSRLEQTLEIIDRVEPTVSQYPELVPDLADALLKTGDMLGNPTEASLERPDDARACYQRAAALAGPVNDARRAQIRARAWIGTGDTYGNSALKRDPALAASWYWRALEELSGKDTLSRQTAAMAHSRLGAISELLGGVDEARQQYQQARRLLPPEKDWNPAQDSVSALLIPGRLAPLDDQRANYTKALDLLAPMLNRPDAWIWHATIETRLALGLAELQASRTLSAGVEFGAGLAIAQEVLAADREDLQVRKELAIALRRRALIYADQGWLADSDALRSQAAEELGAAIAGSASAGTHEIASQSCPDVAEKVSDSQSPSPLRPADLLIANGGSAGVPARIAVFSPASQELSYLAEGSYLSDIVDIAARSRTEFYVLDRNPNGLGGILRLRFVEGHWLQKPVACGGWLRFATSLALQGARLLVAATVGNSVGLIGVDLANGRQSLLGQTNAFAQPGRIVPSGGGNFYVSLYWPGEGGLAQVVRFNAGTRTFAVAGQYGLLDCPAALALTPRGQLIAGDRGWTGSGGNGKIVRIARDHTQMAVSRSSDLSRVTALAAASERDVWFATAAAPSMPSKLFKVDLVTGKTVSVTSADLGEFRALARVD
jgi:serine/threonine protein kinase